MADQAPPQPTAPTVFPRVADPQFRDIYSNASFTGLSPFDITITFAKGTTVADHQVQVDQVAVIMSPQHFKGFVRSLTETLKAYESVFGSLSIPDADTKPLMDAAQIEKTIKDARLRARPQSEPTDSSSTVKKQPSRRSRGASRRSS
jgi:hypothetical protein